MSIVVNIGSRVTGVVVNSRPASSIRIENKHLWPGDSRAFSLAPAVTIALAVFEIVLSSGPQNSIYGLVQKGFFPGFVHPAFLFSIRTGAARFYTAQMGCRRQGLLQSKFGKYRPGGHVGEGDGPDPRRLATARGNGQGAWRPGFRFFRGWQESPDLYQCAASMAV